jgi:hypothetical protein
MHQARIETKVDQIVPPRNWRNTFPRNLRTKLPTAVHTTGSLQL